MTTNIKFSPLESSFVERGIVRRALLFQRDLYSVSILELEPNSKIKKHKHTFDNEKYVFVDTGRVEVCIKGDSHELENNTDKKMTVLAIKWV